MVTSSDVMQEIATIFNITVDDIKGRGKCDELMFPRKIYVYICYQCLGVSGAVISKKLNRERTYGLKEFYSTKKHIDNKELKWIEYWNKYQKESSIYKQLISKKAA